MSEENDVAIGSAHSSIHGSTTKRSQDAAEAARRDGGIYLLLDIILRPLTSHPFRDGTPFQLLTEKHPTIGPALRFFMPVFINLFFSGGGIAGGGIAKKERRRVQGVQHAGGPKIAVGVQRKSNVGTITHLTRLRPDRGMIALFFCQGYFLDDGPSSSTHPYTNSQVF